MSATVSDPQGGSRVTAEAAAVESRVWALLAEVPDPEIPVLSIIDLGIVREVRVGADGRLRVATHRPTRGVRPRR